MAQGLYGPILFGTGTDYQGSGGNDFQSMQKSVSARWEEHKVFGDKPLLEYGGPSLIEVEIKMKWIMPVTADPTFNLFILQEIMDLAIPLPLILGLLPMGRGASLFVMTDLSWNPNYFFQNGVIMGADATLKLKEYATPNLLSALLAALGGLGSGVSGALSGVTNALSGGITGLVNALPGVSNVAAIAGDVSAGQLSPATIVGEAAGSATVNGIPGAPPYF